MEVLYPDPKTIVIAVVCILKGSPSCCLDCSFCPFLLSLPTPVLESQKAYGDFGRAEVPHSEGCRGPVTGGRPAPAQKLHYPRKGSGGGGHSHLGPR